MSADLFIELADLRQLVWPAFSSRFFDLRTGCSGSSCFWLNLARLSSLQLHILDYWLFCHCKGRRKGRDVCFNIGCKKKNKKQATLDWCHIIKFVTRLKTVPRLQLMLVFRNCLSAQSVWFLRLDRLSSSVLCKSKFLSLCQARITFNSSK